MYKVFVCVITPGRILLSGCVTGIKDCGIVLGGAYTMLIFLGGGRSVMFIDIIINTPTKLHIFPECCKCVTRRYVANC